MSDALTAPMATMALFNDKLMGELRVVLLDFAEGTWCFRDELGVKARRPA